MGYVCECPSGFGGDQCHVPDATHTTLRLSLGALAAVLVWCAFLLREYCNVLHDFVVVIHSFVLERLV